MEGGAKEDDSKKPCVSYDISSPFTKVWWVYVKAVIFKESSPFLSARVILIFLQYVLVQLYVLRTSELYNQLGLEIPKPTTYTIYNALVKKSGGKRPHI